MQSFIGFTQTIDSVRRGFPIAAILLELGGSAHAHDQRPLDIVCFAVMRRYIKCMHYYVTNIFLFNINFFDLKKSILATHLILLFLQQI